jgi:hypothetical protein
VSILESLLVVDKLLTFMVAEKFKLRDLGVQLLEKGEGLK